MAFVTENDVRDKVTKQLQERYEKKNPDDKAIQDVQGKELRWKDFNYESFPEPLYLISQPGKNSARSTKPQENELHGGDGKQFEA